MKFRPFQLLLLLSVPLLLLTACDDDDPVIDNDEELITTLIYTLSPTGGGPDRIFTFVDLDGDGGNPPTILSDTLMANTTYTGTIELYNEAEAPREDTAEEVKEEDEELVKFRLSLSKTTAHIIKRAMKLLGIDVPDRM